MKAEITEDTEIKPHQKDELAWAIKELAEAMTERYLQRVMCHSKNALHYIHEFYGMVAPAPELTENEAEHCRALHTYMRKGMDGPLSVLLYRLIDESRGTAIWYSFVKSLVANKGNYREAFNDASKERHNGHDTTDDVLMLAAIEMWKDDFKYAWEYIEDI
jgi:hypothetical protein